MKKLLPLLGGVIVIALAGPARPASGQPGAAITRSQTDATVTAIERQAREATREERDKHAGAGDSGVATPSRKQ
jgi:hypothetical protein